MHASILDVDAELIGIIAKLQITVENQTSNDAILVLWLLLIGADEMRSVTILLHLRPFFPDDTANLALQRLHPIVATLLLWHDLSSLYLSQCYSDAKLGLVFYLVVYIAASRLSSFP